MTRKTRIAVVAGGAVALLAVSLGGLIAANTLLDHEQTDSFTIAGPVTKVIVSSAAGNVDVVAADVDRVSVEQTSRWLTDEPEPTRTLAGGVLRLGDECLGGWAIFRCETDYDITVPRGVDVDVDVEAGNVSVTGVDGTLVLHSDAGNLDGTRLAAESVRADSDAGNVRLAFSAAPTSLDADSDAGNVELELPRAEYAVETDTDSGDTSVSGIVSYDLAAHTVRASSDAGDVTIRGR
jgi:hypothetical protein